MSSWSESEKKSMLGYKADGPVTPTNINTNLSGGSISGGTVNWVDAGKVTPVAN